VVTATDIDSGHNGQVTFELHPESASLPFTVSRNTGLVSSSGPLSSSFYKIKVLAYYAVVFDFMVVTAFPLFDSIHRHILALRDAGNTYHDRVFCPSELLDTVKLRGL